RPVRSGMVLAATWFVLSCSGKESPTAPPVVASVVVTPGGDTLATLGRTQMFSAVATDQNGNPVSATIRWHSTNALVVTVDSVTGLVTAVGNGAAIVRATASGVNGDAIVVVSQAVAHVVISPPSGGFSAVGDTQRFTATAKDSSGALIQGVPFLWVSSDPSVVTVDTGGLVTTRGPGQTQITAAARGIPGSAAMTVTQATTQLAFRVPPADAIAGASLNPAVQVEVRDGNGHVVASSQDLVTIYVSGGPLGGATVFGTSSVNAVNGIAVFSGVSLRRAGAGFTLSATTGVLTSSPSPTFTITPGPVAQVVFTRGPAPTVEANVAFDTLAVGFRDAFGNTIDTGAVNIGVGNSPWPGVSIQGSNGQVLVNGVAKFGDLAITRPGHAYTLLARSQSGVTVSTAPFDVKLTLSAVSAGAGHACGIAPGGTYCWGENAFLQSGGITTGSDSVPGPVPGGLTFTQVAAGFLATCGLVSGGQAYCWGSGFTGERGDSDQTVGNTANPVPVAGNHLFRVLAAGRGHFCGIQADSSAFCWGGNDSGQLGDGSTTSRHYPVPVSGGLAFAQITPGGWHTCGITGTGKAYCWGGNSAGQLGDSTNTPRAVPGAVVGGLSFKMVAAGFVTTCGVTTLNGLICWGSNGNGALGDGKLNDRNAPDLGDIVPFQPDSIVAGSVFGCVHGQTGVACWGDGRFGELGTSSTSSSSVPVFTANSLLLTRITANPGGSFVCARRFDTGRYWCWGANGQGQLGDGSTTDRSEPTPVIQ
ncbi:MAG TPA: Ig-like domain-containing protein, partial [Gemmatimonadales bacterium]|nr:Ig-like domain-containing protein [Gemmatimonadales bacterium]